jgi:hypothetical protein
MFTDGYEQCQQQKLPLMPSYERKLYHPVTGVLLPKVTILTTFEYVQG